MEKENEKYKCPFCEKEIKKGNGHHLKECECFKSFLEREGQKISELYSENGYSVLELSDLYKIPYTTVKRILKLENIELRNLKKSKETNRVKQKYSETMMKNWGTPHNFSKNCPSRKNWEKRLLEEEGITNVFQRKSVIEKIKNTLNENYTEDEKYYNYVKGSTLQYWIEKLGEEDGLKKYQEICYNKGKSNNIKYYIEKYGEEKGKKIFFDKIEAQIKKTLKKCGFQSSLNYRFKNILEKNNINFEQEKVLFDDDKKYFSYDFLIENVIFELNGDFWHANPKKYKENDLLNFPSKKRIVKEIWEHDKKKKHTAIKNGYEFVTIWESEFKKMSDAELIELIKSKINKNEKS